MSAHNNIDNMFGPIGKHPIDDDDKPIKRRKVDLPVYAQKRVLEACVRGARVQPHELVEAFWGAFHYWRPRRKTVEEIAEIVREKAPPSILQFRIRYSDAIEVENVPPGNTLQSELVFGVLFPFPSFFRIEKTDGRVRATFAYFMAAREVNRLFEGAVLVPDTAPLNASCGILNWDVPLTPEPWLVKMCPEFEKPCRTSVILMENKTVRFGSDGVSPASIDYFLAQLNPWKGLWPSVLSSFFLRDEQKDLAADVGVSKFLASDETVAIICITHSVGAHASVLFKHDGMVRVVDPYKKKVDMPIHWKKAIKESGYKWGGTVQKDPDQTNEGSCATIAMARALMMASKEDTMKYAMKPFTDPKTHNYLLLASLMKKV